MPSLDLPAYLARIGYNGSLEPTYETLAGLLAAHMNSIHFENIDVLLGRPIALDLDSLQRKIVRDRRGGYCFEQTTLFDAALRALGFETTARTSRVTVALPLHEAPRTHMFLIVRLPEGDFVVDPGFGGFGCRTPIPASGARVADGGETFGFESDPHGATLKIESGDKCVSAWSVGLDRDNPIDFELGNYWTSAHPTSLFRHNLMLRAMTPRGRVTAMNRAVTIREDGETRSFQLEDRAALRDLLGRYFGMDLPDVETLRVSSVPEWS